MEINITMKNGKGYVVKYVQSKDSQITLFDRLKKLNHDLTENKFLLIETTEGWMLLNCDEVLEVR